MDLISEAPSCDPEIQSELLKARGWAEVVSPAHPTLAVPVECEPRPVADVAPSPSCEALGMGWGYYYVIK